MNERKEKRENITPLSVGLAGLGKGGGMPTSANTRPDVPISHPLASTNGGFTVCIEDYLIVLVDAGLIFFGVQHRRSWLHVSNSLFFTSFSLPYGLCVGKTSRD